MSQCRCPGSTPIVSRELGEAIARAIPEGYPRLQALWAAMQWMVQVHDGLRVYAGIVGRPKAFLERGAIALDVGIVADSTCPFKTAEGCVLGGLLGERYTPVMEKDKPPYGFLPLFVAKALAGEELRRLVQAGLVADAKVTYLKRNTGFVGRDFGLGQNPTGDEPPEPALEPPFVRERILV